MIAPTVHVRYVPIVMLVLSAFDVGADMIRRASATARISASRGVVSILMVAGALAGCQTTKPGQAPVVAPAPIAQVQTTIDGQTWTIAQIPTTSRVDDTHRQICLRFEGDQPSLENIDQRCLLDGNHEQLLVDFDARVVSLWADDPQGFRNHEDGSKFFMCEISDKNRDLYRNAHNICVSRLSTSDSGAQQILAAPFSVPAALFGTKMFVVKVDTKAIASILTSIGAIAQARESERQRIRAIMDATSSSQDLKHLASYRILMADEPDLAAAIRQKISDREAAEAQAAADAALAQRREAEKQLELDRQRAVAEAAEQKRKIAQNHALAEAFRKNLKVGADTHCGVVLSMNGPVAVVQAMAPIGQYGLKISQLYPPGLAECRFFNGVYQDPGLPY